MTTDPKPANPPTRPGPIEHRPAADPLGGYHTVAETVGMVPSLRWKDNAIQAAVVIGSTAIASVIGYFSAGGMGAIMWGAPAMIISALVSGLVLMVLGWVRAAEHRKK